MRGDLLRVADDFRCRRCDGTIQEVDLAEDLNGGGSKRHSLQAVELSQWSQAAVQIVSNLPDLPFFGHAGNADPLDGWRCCSQKRVMSRPIQVRQL